MKSYDVYLQRQKVQFASCETKVDRWSRGQRIYVRQNFADVDKDKVIIDMACGEGVGLRELKKMGFESVLGVEINPQKKKEARKSGYRVIDDDMHFLKSVADDSVDILYSSHTLEHAWDIVQVLKTISRVLRPRGELWVVLPYPDRHAFNVKAHVAKWKLGTTKDDDAKSLEHFFKRNGFSLVGKKYDYYREPEVWLKFGVMNDCPWWKRIWSRLF